MQTKQKYHHGDLAESLVRATISLLNEKGPAGISLREVARRAGVSHGAPAHHFGDKAGLLTAVAIDGHRLLGQALEASLTEGEQAFERLLAAGAAYIRFAVTHSAFFSIMFQSELLNSKDVEYRVALQAARSVLERCVSELAGDKEIDAEQMEFTTMALWSQVHGFSSLWLAGNFGDAKNLEALDAMIERMLRSLRVEW